MLSTVFGLVVLFAPLVATSFFLNKKRGMVLMLFVLILSQTIFAVATQFFGLFYYNVLLATTSIFDIAVILYLARANNARIYKGIKSWFVVMRGIDWVMLVVFFIASLTLFQVHHRYTGKINLATDSQVSYREVSNMRYLPPYFSDEWYAVSLVTNTIEKHVPPLFNQFSRTFFLNLELLFHSFIASIVLILKLNPLTQYTLVGVVVNAWLIVLAYLFLRINNISKVISALVSLGVLYITCGANLPGLWHLLPFNVGVIFCLIAYCFVSLDDFKTSMLVTVLGSLFYPPLFLFNFLIFIYSYWKLIGLESRSRSKILFHHAIIFVILLIAFGVLTIIGTTENFRNYLGSRLFFLSFSYPFSPQYTIYKVIPSILILAAIPSLIFIYEKMKWLFFQLMLGIFLWFLYSLTAYRFMVEYERVVVFTSIIIVILAGFGINETIKYLVFKRPSLGALKYTKVAEIIVFLAYLLAVPYYTQREDWKKLTLIDQQTGAIGYPKAPANNYLTNDDLKLFENIKGAYFLSLPWKGTVIGVATNNYPIVTKEGTISHNKEGLISDFINASCAGKSNMINKYKIQYLYLWELSCEGYNEIGRSAEGLVLYKIK